MAQAQEEVPALEISNTPLTSGLRKGDHETLETGSAWGEIARGDPLGHTTPSTRPETRPKADSSQDYSGLALYLGEIRRFPVLSRQEELELAARHRQGDATARERLITSNLRLVINFARGYEGLGLALQDLISEGNLGLIRAVDRYDPNRGARLATYAAWWIRQSVRRAVKTRARIIRLPNHVFEQFRRLRRTETALRDGLGREPTNEELASRTHFSLELMTLIRRSVVGHPSLDSSLGNAADGQSLAELIPDEQILSPLESLETKSDARLIEEYLAKLKPVEGLTIVRRFGLDGNESASLASIGRELGITTEGVRQIEFRAFRKLRKLMKSLRQF
jgi:RNA polymerase primary sigma factor